jgi:hypothetical protein
VLLDRLPFDELDLLTPLESARPDPDPEPCPMPFRRREGAQEARARRQNGGRRGDVDPKERARLRTKSVTLAELGIAPDPGATAAALVAGFARTLDVEFDSTVGLAG